MYSCRYPTGGGRDSVRLTYTTFGSGGGGADLSPAACSGGMRRRPRAQAVVIENDVCSFA